MGCWTVRTDSPEKRSGKEVVKGLEIIGGAEGGRTLGLMTASHNLHTNWGLEIPAFSQ